MNYTNILLFYLSGVIAATLAIRWLNGVIKQTDSYKSADELRKKKLLCSAEVIFLSWVTLIVALIILTIACLVEGVQLPPVTFLKKITNSKVD